jgi:acetyl-CoA acetyltransferase
VQREWAAKNPRAAFKDPITVDDVLNSRMIAYPFRILQCCLVTDGGGALILTSADRAKDFKTKPVYILGTRRKRRDAHGQPDGGRSTPRAPSSVAGPEAFRMAGIKHSRRRPPDDLRRLRASAAVRARGPRLRRRMARRRTSSGKATRVPAAKLPLNTNGGGLSYTHSGMYGMYALQESVRQMRGTAPAQVPDVKVSVAHGVGGMFSASGTVVLSNQRP